MIGCRIGLVGHHKVEWILTGWWGSGGAERHLSLRLLEREEVLWLLRCVVACTLHRLCVGVEGEGALVCVR